MAAKKKTLPAKIQQSEVVRIRLSAAKYSFLVDQAKKERRKITNLAQVIMDEGIEKRGGPAAYTL